MDRNVARNGDRIEDRNVDRPCFARKSSLTHLALSCLSEAHLRPLLNSVFLNTSASHRPTLALPFGRDLGPEWCRSRVTTWGQFGSGTCPHLGVPGMEGGVGTLLGLGIGFRGSWGISWGRATPSPEVFGELVGGGGVTQSYGPRVSVPPAQPPRGTQIY